MSRQTTILVVAHSAYRGGAEYCLDTLLRHLDRSRFEAIVLFPHNGPMAECAREMGYEVHELELLHWLYFRRSWWYWKRLVLNSVPTVWKLVDFIRQRRVGVVYSNTSAVFEAAIAAKIARVPHVWHIHEVLRDGNRMDQVLPIKAMKRIIHWAATRLVFESHAARAAFESGVPSEKSRVVYNSVRLSCSVPEGPGLAERLQFGLPPDSKVVGFVGQFIDRKNPLLLVRAMARLRTERRICCLFAGEGPLQETIHGEIVRLGLGEQCRIVGFQKDIVPVLRAIDVLVLPSRQESFGLVLVEAASCGKPAIACHCEGASEILLEGETGFVVPQDDDAALAARIREVLTSDERRKKMGDAAALRVAEAFAADRNTRRLEEILAGAVQCRRGHRHVLSGELRSDWN